MILVDSVERMKRFCSMKEYKRTYHFDQDFFLDELDEQVKYEAKKSYEDGGKVDLAVSNSYQLLLLREEQTKMQTKQAELEHLSKTLKQKLNVSLVVNLICFFSLMVVFVLSIQKILQVVSEFCHLAG